MSYQQIQFRIVRKRKKPVSCEWCAQPCEVDKSCCYRSYKFHGEFYTGYMHLECWAASIKYVKLDPHRADEGWSPGDFERGCMCEKGRCTCERPLEGYLEWNHQRYMFISPEISDAMRVP